MFKKIKDFITRYIMIEIVIDKYCLSLGIIYFWDLKAIQFALPFITITFNFSGEWTGGWKSLRIKNDMGRI